MDRVVAWAKEHFQKTGHGERTLNALCACRLPEFIGEGRAGGTYDKVESLH